MSMVSSGLVSTGPSDLRSGGRSAPVLEFVCLFTYDLRRKQKRWEDGRIKYHTFNKRVMVYDERGNFVGDMHWTRESDFDEGEEVQLERGGVIVQVAECVGRQEQDLSELLDRRANEKERRRSRVAMRPPLSAATPNNPIAGAGVREHFQTRHRPLTQLLTPTGHHGRAVVPVESPYELRQMADENPSSRPDPGSSKRRKLDVTPPSKKTYAQNLFGATLTLSAVPVSSAPRGVPGPLPRVQPATTLPQEEDISHSIDVDSLREDRGSSAASGIHRESSSAGAVATRLRAFPAHPRQSVVEDQEQPETTSMTLSHPNQNKANSNSRASNPRAAVTNGFRPSPLTSTKSRVVADKLTTAGNSHQPPLTHLAGASTDAKRSVGLKLGASLLQAVELDDERRFSGRQDKPGVAHESENAAPEPPKQQRTTRKRLPQPTASDVESMTTGTRVKDAQEHPTEERTELRLKPRQKRGLLLLSEKKSKTSQLKAQDGLASGQTRTSESPEELTSTPATESSGHSNLVEKLPFGKQDDPFACSPAGPGDPGSLAKDKIADRPPSPRGRRLRSRAQGSGKARGEPSEPLNLESKETLAGFGSEFIPSKFSRQTRATEELGDEESSRVGKRARRVNPDDSASNELPQAQVRPHLARLSRKSVRSRELIGFVPRGPDHFMNSGLPNFGAKGFKLIRDNDTAGTGNVLESTSIDAPLSNRVQSRVEAQPVGRMPQPALPSTVVSQVAPPALQRHNSLPNGRMGEGSVKVSSKVAPPTPQLDGPPRPRSLARHVSAVFPPNGQMDRSATENSSLPGPKNIALPREETALEVTVSETANPQRPCAADSVTLRSPSHNSPPNISEQQADQMNDESDIALDACLTDGVNKQFADAPPPDPSQPRIVNPATRGRKAALKSHAAGQVPQFILPVDNTTVVLGVRPPAMPRPDPALSEHPKRTMRFPGFSSARGGGPWSREAHDLLESTRPC
ncbi:hypothetical protein N657DRAFT_616439 [Parathielavia appendiculata]|uniref:5'-3' DNA helicase ZGRF1-like N-terminal domain-containing protein n=1 Tax=Parathielavia appendiculata TaxID=2587402 RepID=A0AAN6U2D2_9PEZI|nr:hypothetical protein N657DRAFT_616439 [Parathielavia appendiculata]